MGTNPLQTLRHDMADKRTPPWIPDDRVIRASNIHGLMQTQCLKIYDEFFQWSITDRNTFWDTLVKQIGIRFHKDYRQVLDISQGNEQARWFVDAKLNIVESCFQASNDSCAIVYQAENSSLEELTLGELKHMVNRIANGLIDLGLQTGDRVAIAMTMTIEAVAIYLAIIAAGGVVVTIADSFAANEIQTRLKITHPRWIFTQDVIERLGRQWPLYQKIQNAQSPTAIVLPCRQSLQTPLRDGDLNWCDFLSGNETFSPVAVDAASHCTILFSSGTTGNPKAIPWDHVTPVKGAIDAYLHHDIHPGDLLCWPTNLGWMMGPWLVFSALINKATIALYYGAPTTEDFGRFVQDARVTMLGLVPSLVTAWKSSNCMDGLDWSAIKAFSSTGECSNAADMSFLMALANNKPVIEYCGGTEIGGGYIAGTVVQPSIPGTFSTPALGSEIILLDEQGQLSDQGEVFLIPPAMGLSQELINRDHHEVYFADTPTGPEGQVLRRHGDQLQRLPNGYYLAQGRADDAMNLGGIKVSCIQIEEIVNQLAGVTESGAIAVSPPGGGPSVLVIYLVWAQPTIADVQQLKKKIQGEIRQQLNPLFKVQDVVVTASLPRTASNKIMRRTLRADYENSHNDR